MKDLEQYFTPQWLVDLYFQHVFPSIPVTRILDPACGAGAFENGFHRNLPERTRSDAKNYVEFMTSDIDPKYCTTPGEFAKWAIPAEGIPFDVMVTNPPFTLAKDFAEKGRKLAKVTTLLVRQSFLSTAKRVAWLKKNIPYSVHMFHRRPKFELSEYQIEVKRYNDPKFDPKDWGTYNAEYCFVTWLHESFKNDQDASLIWIGGDDDV